MQSDSFRGLMAQPSYMRYWFSRLFSGLASQVLVVAIGWQMYDLTGSAWDLGLVGLYQFLPALILALWAGHVADRFHRGRIVAVCLLIQMLISAVLAAGSLGVGGSGVTRELLLITSVVVGASRAFQFPAQTSLVALLVPPSMLSRAMAFSSSGMQTGVIVGPALGGFIFAYSTSAVYLFCAIFFGAAGALLFVTRYDHAPRAREPVTIKTLLAGFHFIFQKKVVLGAMSLDLFAVLLGGATALLPIFAKDYLHVGAWGLGLLRAAPAVGALLMSIALVRWPLKRHIGRTMLLTVAVFGLATTVFGVSTSFVLSLLCLAVTGGADMVSVVVRQTLVQLETPDEMRGRVSAVHSIFVGASNELGEFESGATAALMGPVGAVVLGGLGSVLIAALWVKVFPELARRDRAEPEPRG